MTRPTCPICGATMAPVRVECEDGSGWLFGWACLCDETAREADGRFQEVIVEHSKERIEVRVGGVKLIAAMPLGVTRDLAQAG